MRSIVSTVNARPSMDRDGFTVKKLYEALENGYMLLSRESEFRTKKSFAPSSIGYQHGTCPRYWHIAFTGAHFQEYVDPVGVAMMGAGTDAHERIQKALTEAGVVIEVERELNNEDPPIRGFIDLVLNIDGEEVVGEIKTTGSDAFRYRSVNNKPAAYHLYQVLLYMRLLDTHQGFILYENRDNMELAVIRVTLDEKNKEIIDKALDWMRSVHNNWKEGGEIPKAPWTQRNKSCKTCPVFEACWNEGLPVGSDKIGAMEVHKP